MSNNFEPSKMTDIKSRAGLTFLVHTDPTNLGGFLLPHCKLILNGPCVLNTLLRELLEPFQLVWKLVLCQSIILESFENFVDLTRKGLGGASFEVHIRAYCSVILTYCVYIPTLLVLFSGWRKAARPRSKQCTRLAGSDSYLNENEEEVLGKVVEEPD